MIEIDERDARRLVCAVVIQAIRDHRRGDESATAWLLGDALPWLEMADMPRDAAEMQRALSSDVKLVRGSRAG